MKNAVLTVRAYRYDRCLPLFLLFITQPEVLGPLLSRK